MDEGQMAGSGGTSMTATALVRCLAPLPVSGLAGAPLLRLSWCMPVILLCT